MQWVSPFQAYVDMRKIGSGKGMVSAYPRQLESLIRLAEAHAKVRFSEKVETIDVEEAKRLHREALKQSATDPRTGIVDISILTTGLCFCRVKAGPLLAAVLWYLKCNLTCPPLLIAKRYFLCFYKEWAQQLVRGKRNWLKPYGSSSNQRVKHHLWNTNSFWMIFGHSLKR